ncbi:Chemotaxis protein CheA [Azospirillaceae bacterium]
MEDLSRFKQTYFDESAELLGVAEAGLLRLTPGNVDMDEVNAIFRAVHSIKGGGGAFGFIELVNFAHEFEAVMDGLRSDRIPVTAELVDALIRANDVLGQMLAHASDGTEPDMATAHVVVVALQNAASAAVRESAGDDFDSGDVDEMRSLSSSTSTLSDDEMGGVFDDIDLSIYQSSSSSLPAAAGFDSSAGGAGFLAAPLSVAEGKTLYLIEFLPKADLLLSGNEPAFMLRALARLGEFAVVCDLTHLPELGHLEPELLYLKWRVRLETAAGRDQIEDVFEFVSDECVVNITVLASNPKPPEAPAASAKSGDAKASEAKPFVAPGAASSGQSRASSSQPASSQPAVAASRVPLPSAAPVEAASSPPASRSAVRPPAAASTISGGKADPSHAAPIGGHTIRVDLDKIDRLVNMVGEMVITQAMVAEHVRELPQGAFQELLEGLEQLAQHTRELRESVMSIRAQPVSSVFSRMPRLVRELAAETGKDVQLVTSGENTEVDKTVVENLVDPLTHMIRNSIDHGLETPDDRAAVGKNRTGSVHLSAQHRSGRIVIEVSDDGRGINRPRVLQKAMEKGLIPQGANLTDEEIDNLIFLPGFSTVEKVSNISGRGVGMDVVRRNITSLGGRIGVYSTPGEGSRFVLSLPLTLAVLDGMVISVGEERFVLPLTNIVESLRPKTSDLHGLVNQCDVIMARGEYVRLAYLDRLFGIPGAVGDATKGLVVLVETEEGGRLGLVVDEVLGQQQVVIKSLEANYRRLDGVAAATILGDGRVALILDVAGLKEMSQQVGHVGASVRSTASSSSFTSQPSAI